ncbi:PIR Superfamily Protein [Plasmodium ovale wallikeri]|uniref:PIR Superfamily Protein n=1 Tax=Plasmodium ovale wallikeri TaxID=864142 RepID=A0A1A9AQW6_PLAOA|nr:PIR Superfamily Protein [Plasmodium ovale wallikeri]SBT59087.1 PIR Superfamily Protein [Plasmodium ovale wallikeri]
MGISVSDLPSKKFNNIWDEGICKSEVTDIITHKKVPDAAYTWVANFGKNFKVNLDKHQVDINDNTLEKRCRDLYYIIYDILYKLKNLEGYKNNTYDSIKETIKGYINSAFINKRYWSCVPASINEADYEYAKIKDKKYIDDLGEDVTYVENNIDDINSSHECSVIKLYLEQEFRTRNDSYNLDNETYTKIIQYYKKSNFDSLKDIIEKINCNTGGDFQVEEHLVDQETPVNSFPLNIVIVPVLSLLGFILIIYFLYKVTPFSSWFDRKMRKKIIFSNNVNDEISHKTLEEACEYQQTNAYHDEYNVLYNSVADT